TQVEFEFTLDLLLDGLERIKDRDRRRGRRKWHADSHGRACLDSSRGSDVYRLRAEEARGPTLFKASANLRMSRTSASISCGSHEANVARPRRSRAASTRSVIALP